MTTLGEKIDEV
jgi:hypothetical protein